MSVPTAAGLSRGEKQELLRKLLAERTSRPRTAPASFAQERLWFLHRLQPESAAYNHPLALRLTGVLDAAALERALGEVVRRHEALRTTLAETDDGLAQVIAPFAGFVLPVDDLSALDAAEREAEVLRRVAADAAHPFDLARGPLFRAGLLRVQAEEHVLVLAAHHAVIDGWGQDVLLRELGALYGAYCEGHPSPLPALKAQYADYAAWQRERLQGQVLERELAWWRERLAGAPALLELPTDRPRPAELSPRGAREWTELGAALLERLEALARGERTTLFTVLMAAFNVLLAKYAGSDDVVVGTPVSGRTRTETEELIGCFVNTLALRTDLSGDPPFREVLRRVHEGMLAADRHQEVPFERVLEELNPGRTLSFSPVFQVMLTLQQPEREEEGGESLRVKGVESGLATTKLDLTLGFSVDAGRFHAATAFSTDLFERATIRRMLRHLATLLEQVADRPRARISELALADEAERRRLVEEWSGAGNISPVTGTVHGHFEARAAATPDAVAVADGDQTLTYGQLDRRADRLARHLVRLGVGPEVRVGLCLERGVEMVVSFLAILKAGGACVPLDPGHPAERLRWMLADAGAAVLVTRENLRATLGVPPGVRVVSVDGKGDEDGDGDEIAGAGAESPRSIAGPESLACVMYTSGSTGTPRAVGVEHRGIVRLVRGADYADLGPGEVILQAAPVTFDASTLEIWGALLNGGRLVPMRGNPASVVELGRELVRHGVTTLWLTAGLFQVMVEERLEELGGLRQLLAGGDVLPAEAVRKLRERFPHLRLVNGYGPTENTTFTCCHTVTDDWDGGPVPIGTPISSTRVYVLDRALRPVPIGVPGELHAGGAGVARGYLGRPALTAEKFIPDPFSAEPGARLYRTGDRVRWRADGTLEFLGRRDGQVKIRGFRVEPGEVEAALRRHPLVRQCVVAAREDAPGDRRLVAWVAGGADAGELRAHLRRTLPDHLVPAAFVAVDALPLKPNGKVDHAALPAPAFTPAGCRVAPRTPAEELLAGIWAAVLRVERVGAHDSFFDLGGHSLLATRAVSRVREVFGVELPLRALFEGPTIAEVAERVEALRGEGRPPPRPLVPAGRGGAIPLSFAQERLWFLARMEPESPFYNVPVAMRLSGALDVPALERALGEVV
ncbi:MAG TPA: amino acid adenylation domain-containing protein, partial [Longimicrobiaceae bacterium]